MKISNETSLNCSVAVDDSATTRENAWKIMSKENASSVNDLRSAIYNLLKTRDFVLSQYMLMGIVSAAEQLPLISLLLSDLILHLQT